MKKNTSFANIIATAFHPILWVYYLLVFITILFRTVFTSPTGMIQFLGASFFITIMFPVMTLWALLRLKKITSLRMDDRKERTLPLFIVGISYYMIHYLFKIMSLPQSFQLLFLGATFMIFVCMLITFFWKISIHMLSIGSTIGFVIALGLRYDWLMPQIVLPMILIAGLVGYSRLKLNAHTPAQVYVGFITGFCIMLFGVSFL